MSFQAEQRLVKLRPRATRLILPTLLLGVVCGILAFIENRQLESWLVITINVVAAVAVLLFWSVPLTRHLMQSLEVTTSRLVWRDGLFGRHRREISWFEVAGVEYARRRVTVFIHGQEPLVLAGLPKAKQLALELQELVRG